MPTLGLFPNFSRVHSFLSEKELRKGFYWKNKHIGSSVKDRKKLNRLVKACVRFYACISSLLILNQISFGITGRFINRRSLSSYSSGIICDIVGTVMFVSREIQERKGVSSSHWTSKWVHLRDGKIEENLLSISL